MKTATAEPYAYTVTCAYCEELMQSKRGFAFHSSDYLKEEDLIAECSDCGKVNKLPKKMLCGA